MTIFSTPMRCAHESSGCRATIRLHPQHLRDPVKYPVKNLIPHLPHLRPPMARIRLRVRATTLKRVRHRVVIVSILRNRPINLLPLLPKPLAIIMLLLLVNLRPRTRMEVDTTTTMTRHNNNHLLNGRSIIPRPAHRVLAKFPDRRGPRRLARPPPRRFLTNAPLRLIHIARPLLRHPLHTITRRQRQPIRLGVKIQHVITRRPGLLAAEMSKVFAP